MDALAARVGCATDRRGLEYFKKQLRDVADQQSLPEYEVTLTEEKLPSPGGGRPRLRTMVRFRLRPLAIEGGEGASAPSPDLV